LTLFDFIITLLASFPHSWGWLGMTVCCRTPFFDGFDEHSCVHQ
jgi:hypothetical protein